MYLCGLYIPSLRVRNEVERYARNYLITKTQKLC